MITKLRTAAETAYNTGQDVQVNAGLILALLDKLEAAEKDAARIRNAALEEAAKDVEEWGFNETEPYRIAASIRSMKK